MYLQQYWYVGVYRIYGSRTRYTAGSQQIGMSPAVRRTRIHLGNFLYGKSKMKHCAWFSCVIAGRRPARTRYGMVQVYLHFSYKLGTMPATVGATRRVVAPEHSKRNFVYYLEKHDILWGNRKPHTSRRSVLRCGAFDCPKGSFMSSCYAP
eukprot:SAG11_NODE_14_length_26344_cov_14.209411_7_plen_151_part_00